MGFLSGLLSPVLGAVGTAFGGPIGGAIGSMVGGALGGSSSSGGGSGGGAVAAADPFASQRGQYQQQLSAMMKPGATFSPSDPSYKFRMDQGLEGVNRGAAASGMLNSGNRLAALTDYSSNLASQEYANQFSRLSQLSGANIGSPAAASQAITSQNASSSAAGQQIGTALGGGIKSWWDGINTPTPAANVPYPQSSLPGVTIPAIM